MRLSVVEGNTQRLDGGAMFGNAPRELWKRWCKTDDLNRIPLATRCLLLQTDDGRNVLFEAGVGCFFDPKYRERYGVMQDEHMLLSNLEKLGLSDADIDIVILSHMHFDHVGGLVSMWDGGDLQLLFPNASIYTGKEQWEHALNPHFRDRASYIQEIHKLLADSGRMKFLTGSTHADLDFGVSFEYFEGHTPGQAISRLDLPGGPLYYTGDLVPGMAWIHLPIVMGYDRFAERTVDEKQAFLAKAFEEEAKLYFVHDPQVSCAGIHQDENGRYTGYASDLEALTRLP